MNDLTSEVARRLAAVPHAPECKPSLSVANGVTIPCACDREARIAALVAGAMSALIEDHARTVDDEWGFTDSADRDQFRLEQRELALRALEGTP